MQRGADHIALGAVRYRRAVVAHELRDAILLAQVVAFMPVALHRKYDSLRRGVVVEYPALEGRLDGHPLEVVKRF